ncbi:uncharacterized protein H6S33_011853 [Morchella sextelata]|uniref:uncharacterized protein n=1 Tax=Morchella sextelata TaxID=1174677 RepID=UPI001D043A98|nr:uncharacterized protein H6S33_011853 [Morchella sextelata]KAH0610326.1 hypothetical protein H6S33_011853 [Morchella sextelata]
MSEEAPNSPDTTPISPIKERKNSLEQALKARPDEKELKERHILHTGAPAIQQVQHDLETAMAKDALKKHLAKRPEKEDLVQRNILPVNANAVAPGIVAHQKELERSMLEDNLKEKLAHRPDPKAVIQQGILLPDEDPTRPQE